MHGYTRGTHWGAQSTRGLPVERWAVHGEAYSQGLLLAVDRGGDGGDQSRSAEERRRAGSVGRPQPAAVRVSPQSKAPPTKPEPPSEEAVLVLARGEDKDEDGRLLPLPHQVLHWCLNRSEQGTPRTMGRCPRGELVQSSGSARVVPGSYPCYPGGAQA